MNNLDNKDHVSIYKKYFGEPNISDLHEILESKLPDDEKLICIKGWLKLFEENL